MYTKQMTSSLSEQIEWEKGGERVLNGYKSKAVQKDDSRDHRCLAGQGCQIDEQQMTQTFCN